MFWFEAEHPETGEALEVAAIYFPSRRGERDGFGVPLEPDEAEAAVICEVRNCGGELVAFQEFEAALGEAGLHVARKAD